MSYPEEERRAVAEQARNATNKKSLVSLAFAYNMYDVMRLQLEELQRIGNTMESILDIINSEQKNQ